MCVYVTSNAFKNANSNIHLYCQKKGGKAHECPSVTIQKLNHEVVIQWTTTNDEY